MHSSLQSVRSSKLWMIARYSPCRDLAAEAVLAELAPIVDRRCASWMCAS